MSGGSELWADLAGWLTGAGITRVCGAVGEGIGLLESASAVPELTVLTTPGPKSATHAAHGISIAYREPVAVWVSAGPGIAGAVPALLEAHSAKAPLLVFCPGTARGARDSGAFQHLDVQRLVEPLSRYQARIEVAEELPSVLDAALFTVRHRGGPALIEVPADLQGHCWLSESTRLAPPLPRGAHPGPEAVARLVALLDASQRPVLLLGGGCDRAVGRIATQLGSDYGVAVLTTAAARGLVDENEGFALGSAGLYMQKPVLELVRTADLVIAAGTALEETARWGWMADVEDHLVHVDTDVNAFSRGTRPSAVILSDASALLRRVAADVAPAARDSWRSSIWVARKCLLDKRNSVTDAPVRAILLAIQEVLHSNAVLVLENGLSDLWAYHFPALMLGPNHTVIVPAEQTGLGFALPAAAGVAVDKRSSQVVAICGDGAFRAGLDGLDVLAVSEAGLLLVVIENGGYGWPRLQQRHLGVAVGCDWRLDLSAEVTARCPSAMIRRPEPNSLTALSAAVREAAVHAASGKLAVIGVRTDWDADLPDAIQDLAVEQPHG